MPTTRLLPSRQLLAAAAAIIRALHALADTIRQRQDTTFAAGSGYVRVAAARDRYSVVTHARATSPLRLFTPRTGAPAAWIVTSTLGGGLVGGDNIQFG